MDKSTIKEAQNRAEVEALLDLEDAIRRYAEAAERQNKILSVAVFLGFLLTGALLYGVYWVETHNTLSKVIAG